MALQFAQAQGKVVTGQYIFQLANQIIQDPNGVLAQAILQLVNQDDGGRTSHTTTIIKNVIKIREKAAQVVVTNNLPSQYHLLRKLLLVGHRQSSLL